MNKSGRKTEKIEDFARARAHANSIIETRGFERSEILAKKAG